MKESILLNTDGQNPAALPTMAVATVTLDGFRNYASETASRAEGFNILCGKNAQGKTNFLGGAYPISATRLLRGHRDGEAVLEGRDRASVTVELTGSETRLGMV